MIGGPFQKQSHNAELVGARRCEVAGCLVTVCVRPPRRAFTHAPSRLPAYSLWRCVYMSHGWKRALLGSSITHFALQYLVAPSLAAPLCLWDYGSGKLVSARTACVCRARVRVRSKEREALLANFSTRVCV